MGGHKPAFHGSISDRALWDRSGFNIHGVDLWRLAEIDLRSIHGKTVMIY